MAAAKGNDSDHSDEEDRERERRNIKDFDAAERKVRRNLAALDDSSEEDEPMTKEQLRRLDAINGVRSKRNLPLLTKLPRDPPKTSTEDEELYTPAQFQRLNQLNRTRVLLDLPMESRLPPDEPAKDAARDKDALHRAELNKKRDDRMKAGIVQTKADKEQRRQQRAQEKADLLLAKQMAEEQAMEVDPSVTPPKSDSEEIGDADSMLQIVDPREEASSAGAGTSGVQKRKTLRKHDLPPAAELPNIFSHLKQSKDKVKRTREVRAPESESDKDKEPVFEPRSPAKKVRKGSEDDRAHILWRHFGKEPNILEGATHRRAICQIRIGRPPGRVCDRRYARPQGSTGGMRTHVMRMHPDIWDDIMKEKFEINVFNDRARKSLLKTVRMQEIYDANIQRKFKCYVLN